MKKLLLIIFLLLFIPSVSAYFTIDHEYWTVTGFEEIDSPITSMCRDKLDIVIDGNFGADTMVLHYTDEGVNNYIFSHTRGGYLAGQREAGSELDKKCFMVGAALHIIQDYFMHTELVPKYIKKYFSSNLLAHMTVEKDFEDKHAQYLKEKGNDLVATGRLEYYNKNICSNLLPQSENCPQCKGDYKYIELLNEMTGIDVRNDVNIICSGYKGVGFYDTVYNEKVKLPWWFWGISIGMLIVGLCLAITAFIFGKSNWKWVLVVMYLFIGIIGLLILVSFYTNNTWAWVEFSLKVVPIRVTNDDIANYHTKVQDATNYFLQTGNLLYDDASGLSYVDRNGVEVKGALSQAEKAFNYGLFPVMTILFMILNIWLFYKTYL